MRKVLLIIGLFPLIISPCLPPLVLAGDNADTGDSVSGKDQYELQEQCDKRCEEIFRKEFGHTPHTIRKNADGTTVMVSYQNHYNQKLNKCFILKSFVLTANSHLMRQIYDANDNKLYGICVEHSSDISKDCTSKDWLDIRMKTMEK